MLLDPDGAEVTGATGSLMAHGHPDARDAILTFSIDLWNLTFPSPGDYSFRILVNGSERKRLGLVLVRPPAAEPDAGRRRPGRDGRPRQRRGPAAGPPATSARPSTRRPWSPRGPATGCSAAARDAGTARWVAYLEPLPDRLRDDDDRRPAPDGAARAVRLRAQGLRPRRRCRAR